MQNIFLNISTFGKPLKKALIRSGGRIDYASIFDQYGHLFFLHCMSSSYHIRLQFSIQFQRHIRLHIDPLRAVILL